MWVDLALGTARELLAGGQDYDRTVGLCGPDVMAKPCNLVVITDGRFRNELLAVRAAGGATVKIEAQGSGLTGTAAAHASETEQNSIPESWFDVVLENDKSLGLESLQKLVLYLADRLQPGPRLIGA
jgi:hypothetical protein